MPLPEAIPRPELLDLPAQVEGQHIVLRAYRADDGEAMFAGISAHRDELMQWMAWPKAHLSVLDSSAYTRRMAAEFALRRVLVMAIWDGANGTYMGGTGFHAPDWSVPAAEFGYFLLPPYRGRGYATEALRLLVDYGLRHARFARVWGTCDAANAASVHVMERAGLRKEGTLRQNNRDHRGKLRDSCVFSLAHDEYERWRSEHRNSHGSEENV